MKKIGKVVRIKTNGTEEQIVTERWLERVMKEIVEVVQIMATGTEEQIRGLARLPLEHVERVVGQA